MMDSHNHTCELHCGRKLEQASVHHKHTTPQVVAHNLGEVTHPSPATGLHAAAAAAAAVGNSILPQLLDASHCL